MNKGIAIAGTIAVDEIKLVDRYPKKTELTTISHMKRTVGGAVANCSLALSQIDSDILIETICILGEDEKGEYVYNQLKQKSNINVSNITFKGATPFTDVIQDQTDKTRTFYHYKGNASLFNEDTIDFSKLNSRILHIGYLLLLDGLDEKDAQYGTKMALLLKNAQEHGIKTSIDVVSENQNRYKQVVLPSLKYTNYCVINEYEASKITGITLREKDELLTKNIKKVLELLKSYGVKDWVIIHAPEGSFGYDGHEFVSLSSMIVNRHKIKGTVGAGDAYVSGVLYEANKGASMQEAMELGTITAATSLLKEDATSGILPYQQLLEALKDGEKHPMIKI